MDTESFLLPVLDIVHETDDACSVVLGMTPEAEGHFDYKPGQFLTVAIPSDRTGLVARCYSLSSTPADDSPLTITVKRTAEGYASNWICGTLAPGDKLRVLPPSGIFTPKDLDADLLLLAAGSGVTPIISIARTALARGTGRVVVFYANRDERSVIFGPAWGELAAAHPDRLVVVHWLESLQGLPTQEQLKSFASHFADFDAFCCGPAPFMKSVSLALRELEFPRERRHQEKFVSLGGNPFGNIEEVSRAEHEIEEAESDGPGTDESDASAEPDATPTGPVKLEVELDGADHTFDDWSPGTKLLEHLESKGVDAPFSCREGNCSACACRILEGEVRMLHNEVLDDEDLADGIRLACQSLPLTDRVRITYH